VDRIRAAVAHAVVVPASGGSARLPYVVPALAARSFRLPPLASALPPATAAQSLARCVDEGAAAALAGDSDNAAAGGGELPAINWWPKQPASSHLVVYWNGATGDCLLDAVAQAAWGVTLRCVYVLQACTRAAAVCCPSSLIYITGVTWPPPRSGSSALQATRTALAGMLRDHAALFEGRWRAFHQAQHSAAGFSLSDDQVCACARVCASNTQTCAFKRCDGASDTPPWTL